MPREYFFLYLAYGAVYIGFVTFAPFKKYDDVSHLSLVRSLQYLVLFGVTHGLSEWVTMVVISELYSEYYISLFIGKQFLKALSFAFLIRFGLELFPEKSKIRRFRFGLPLGLFLLWSVGFGVLMLRNGVWYHIHVPQFNTVMLRYAMGLPGGLITAWALRLQVQGMQERRLWEIAHKYNHLALIFFLYGLVDGLVVRKMEFFPANIISNQAFKEWFGFPIQLIKISIGIAIILLLGRVVATFGWEQAAALRRLERKKIEDDERRKLGLEIHDSIIQSIYGSKLQIEYLIDTAEMDSTKEHLQRVKVNLAETIRKTREFIHSTVLEQISFDDLTLSVQELAQTFNKHQRIQLTVESHIEDCPLEEISARASSQIYYIIQEAINNVIKHSKASKAKVTLLVKAGEIHIKVIDDGTGFSLVALEDKSQFGFDSMKARARSIGGVLNVKSRKDGVEVELMVPMEGIINEV